MKIKKLLIMLSIVFLCGEEFRNTYKTEKKAGKYKKVRDHWPFTGRYRGCAHSICNLNYCSKQIKIPVFFHNMEKIWWTLNNTECGAIKQQEEEDRCYSAELWQVY